MKVRNITCKICFMIRFRKGSRVFYRTFCSWIGRWRILCILLPVSLTFFLDCILYFLSYSIISQIACSHNNLHSNSYKPSYNQNKHSNNPFLVMPPPTQKRQQNRRKARGGVDYPFPERLFDLLEEVDTRKPLLSSIISWQPNGKLFTVHDRDAFENVIQSTYFNQTKFASFRRQLNLWGFERVGIAYDKSTTDSSVGGSFFHPLFQRHNRRLCCTMKRTKAIPRSGVIPRMNGGLEGHHGSDHQKVYPFSASENMIEERSVDTFATGLASATKGNTNTALLTNLCLPKVSTNLQTVSSDDGSSLPSQDYIQNQEENKQEYEFHPTTNHDMKEFKDLIDFLSANDDNIIQFLLGGDTTKEEESRE